MPHDMNGLELKAGDRVMVPCTVKTVTSTEGDGYCNVTVETEQPMYPTDNKTTVVLNAKQVRHRKFGD